MKNLIDITFVKLKNPTTHQETTNAAAREFENRSLEPKLTDPAKTVKNIPIRFDSSEDILESVKVRMAEVNTYRPIGKKKVLDDDIVLCEATARLSKETSEKLEESKLIDLFEDIYKGFEATLGRDIVIGGIIHFDEEIPHMHFFWEPVSSELYYCVADKLNKHAFRRYEDELKNYLQAKGWGDYDCCTKDDTMNYHKQLKLSKKECREI